MMYQNITMDAVTRYGADVLHRTNFKWKPTINEVLGNIAEKFIAKYPNNIEREYFDGFNDMLSEVKEIYIKSTQDDDLIDFGELVDDNFSGIDYIVEQGIKLSVLEKGYNVEDTATPELMVKIVESLIDETDKEAVKKLNEYKETIRA